MFFKYNKDKDLKIVEKKKIFFTISSILILIAILTSFIFGVKIDIQFKGGTVATYSYEGEINKGDVANLVKQVLNKSADIRESKDFASGRENLIISISGNESISVEQQSELTNKLKEQYKDNNIQLEQVSNVDPNMGRDFFIKSIVAVALALMILVIYIALRFKVISGWSAGVMAVIALIHDVLIVYATFVIFRIPLNDNFIAVLLVILGYSINDTIVIYDRVRENKKLLKNSISISTTTLVDRSITQCMTRSINTTVSTVLAMVVVCVISVIYNLNSIVTFAFPLIIGMISGVYSTNCIALPLWVMWQDRNKKD